MSSRYGIDRIGETLPTGSRRAAKKQRNPGEVFDLILDKKVREQGGVGLYGAHKSDIQRPLFLTRWNSSRF